MSERRLFYGTLCWIGLGASLATLIISAVVGPPIAIADPAIRTRLELATFGTMLVGCALSSGGYILMMRLDAREQRAEAEARLTPWPAAPRSAPFRASSSG